MQPFHFDYWMLSLVRWQPRKERNYPSEITFWVKVLGVPLEFWAAQTFESIGEALGEWLEVDMDHGRIKVKLDGYKELRFEITVDFKGGEFHDGEEALISLRYEKLFGYCHICFSLCHKTELCLLNPKSLERKKESRDAISGKQGDRARSYKGVVINGNSGYHDKEKEHIDYVGKGKGKMYEEPESKWVKVPERDNTRTSNNRYSGRGDEGGSRNRNLIWETVRNHHPEERGRASRCKNTPALVGTLKVSVASENVEKAVALVNDTVGHRNQKLDEDVMDFDEHGVDVEGQDEVLCDAGRVEETEEEIEETDTFPEDLNAIT
ncbi:uncharacterized protein LOC106452113 [Brassica napus]|nr:uncharacterized protein LOC106452113 [Brassica napus]